MKFGSPGFKILLSIAPLFFIVLHLFDIYDIYFGKADYPFGSDFFASNSIYQSRNYYVSFTSFATLFLIITIFLIWKQKWKLLIIIALVDLIFILYPLFTND